MKWVLLTVAIVAFAIPASASSTTQAKKTLSTYDKYYLESSIMGDIYEVKAGNLANQKGSSEAVKSLGSALIKDHTKSLGEATKLAHKLGLKVPKSPTPTQQWELSMVAGLSGKDFDKALSSLEVADHIQDIQDAQEEASSGTNVQIRALARKDLPTLKKHLSMARTALKGA
jgi:putative membrane protein